MQKRLIFKIVVLMGVLSLFSCDGGSKNELGGGPPKPAPVLTDVEPEVNDSSVLIGIGVGITATFDKNMEPAAADSFMVYGSLTGKLDGVYSGGGTDTLRFDPAADYQFGEEIEVILTDMLMSTDGGFFAASFVYRFRAEARPGSGNFEAAPPIAAQAGTSALAVGDWDGDGYLDLASANFSANQVSLLFNDGTGVFAADMSVTGQTGTSALAAGDWDGDGDPDLASANTGVTQVRILVNNGAGVFALGATVAGQSDSRALVAGDWDGDGDLDLASANFGANQVGLLFNDGAGVFTPVAAGGLQHRARSSSR